MALTIRAIAAVVIVTISTLPGPAASAAATPPPVPATPRVLAGIEQVYVTGIPPGDTVSIARFQQHRPQVEWQPLATATADRLGSVVFRNLTQGARYVVRDATTGWSATTKVLVAGDNPPESFYRATTMHEGLNYIPMRDGVTLAATVRPPVGRRLADGPFPTVIEYSGYQVAAPADALTNIVNTALGKPTDPLAPAGSTYVGSLILRLAGYAVVSVQLRGSGCSGGEADLFDLPSAYDGYDAVETVAAQGFVSGARVGMVGISFSAFSQIVTAGTRPPHLAAIAPLSFLGRLWDVGRPGGIVNNGFAEGWLRERQDNAEPAPSPGALPYANALVATDAACRENQAIRLQTRDAITAVRTQPTMTSDYTRRDFTRWMSEIDVPVFGSLQFQDEQTSAYAMLAAQTLLDANDKVWLNLSSGEHNDSIDVGTFVDLLAFLDIYVAGRSPEIKPLIYLISTQIWGPGHGSLPLPPSLFRSHDEAAANSNPGPASASDWNGRSQPKKVDTARVGTSPRRHGRLPEQRFRRCTWGAGAHSRPAQASTAGPHTSPIHLPDPEPTGRPGPQFPQATDSASCRLR